MVLMGGEYTDSHEDKVVSLLGCPALGSVETFMQALRTDMEMTKLMANVLVYQMGVEQSIERMVNVDICIGHEGDEDEFEYMKLVIMVLADILTPGDEWDFRGNLEEKWTELASCAGYLNDVMGIL